MFITKPAKIVNMKEEIFYEINDRVEIINSPEPYSDWNGKKGKVIEILYFNNLLLPHYNILLDSGKITRMSSHYLSYVYK
jgi:hypothetical protein